MVWFQCLCWHTDKVQDFKNIYLISAGLSKPNWSVFPVVAALALILVLLCPCQLCFATHIWNSCLTRHLTVLAIQSRKSHVMPHPQLASPASSGCQPSLKFLKVEFSLKTVEHDLFLVSLFFEESCVFQHYTGYDSRVPKGSQLPLQTRTPGLSRGWVTTVWNTILPPGTKQQPGFLCNDDHPGFQKHWAILVAAVGVQHWESQGLSISILL